MVLEHLFDKILIKKILKFYPEYKFFEKVKGDASARRYYRVKSNKKSLIICIDKNIKKSSYVDYLTNVRESLKEAKVKVPSFYKLDMEKGYCVQEDLGSEMLLDKLLKKKDLEEEFLFYKMSLDCLLQIQKTNPGNFLNKMNICFFKKEIKKTNEEFWKFYLKKELTKEENDEIEKNFSFILLKLADLPLFFVHRDFHSKNLMFKNDSLFVIDFQDSLSGSLFYDIVSLLEDCYYDISPSNKTKLRKYYYKSLIDSKIFLGSYDEFAYFYNLMKIQRLYKVLGTFAYLHHHQGKSSYLNYTDSIFKNMEQAFVEINDFFSLKEILSRLYYGN